MEEGNGIVGGGFGRCVVERRGEPVDSMRVVRDSRAWYGLSRAGGIGSRAGDCGACSYGGLVVNASSGMGDALEPFRRRSGRLRLSPRIGLSGRLGFSSRIRLLARPR